METTRKYGEKLEREEKMRIMKKSYVARCGGGNRGLQYFYDSRI